MPLAPSIQREDIQAWIAKLRADRRARDQERCAKELVNAYFMTTGDIRRPPVTSIQWTQFGRRQVTNLRMSASKFKRFVESHTSRCRPVLSLILNLLTLVHEGLVIVSSKPRLI
jgi:hypothetical protein